MRKLRMAGAASAARNAHRGAREQAFTIALLRMPLPVCSALVEPAWATRVRARARAHGTAGTDLDSLGDPFVVLAHERVGAVTSLRAGRALRRRRSWSDALSGSDTGHSGRTGLGCAKTSADARLERRVVGADVIAADRVGGAGSAPRSGGPARGGASQLPRPAVAGGAGLGLSSDAGTTRIVGHQSVLTLAIGVTPDLIGGGVRTHRWNRIGVARRRVETVGGATSLRADEERGHGRWGRTRNHAEPEQAQDGQGLAKGPCFGDQRRGRLVQWSFHVGR